MSDASASTYGGAQYVHGPLGAAVPRTHTFTDAQLAEHDREVAAKERDRLVSIAESYTLGTVQGRIARLGIVAALRHLPDDADRGGDS